MRRIVFICIVACSATVVNSPRDQQAALFAGSQQQKTEEVDTASTSLVQSLGTSLAGGKVGAVLRVLNLFSRRHSEPVEDALTTESERQATAAYWAVRGGDYDRGMVLLRKAIEQSPDDRGKNYDSLPTRELSAEALEHGRQQVLRMLEDRPVMRAHIAEDLTDPLSQWAIRKFAGEDTGFTIDWDPRPPESEFMAEHQIPTDDRRGAIRIAKTDPSGPRKDRELTFEELWACAVFELHNICSAEDFLQLYAKAWAGGMTRSDFIDEVFRVEYRALELTRGFYCYVYLPWAKEKQLPSDPVRWYTTSWGDPIQVMRTYSDHFRSYREYHGQYYDAVQVQRLTMNFSGWLKGWKRDIGARAVAAGLDYARSVLGRDDSPGLDALQEPVVENESRVDESAIGLVKGEAVTLKKPARSELERRFIELATDEARSLDAAELEQAVAAMEKRRQELVAQRALHDIAKSLEELVKEHPKTEAASIAAEMLKVKAAP